MAKLEDHWSSEDCARIRHVAKKFNAKPNGLTVIEKEVLDDKKIKRGVEGGRGGKAGER